MKEFTNQLIEIYARCKWSEVGEDSEYRTLLDENEGEACFYQERTRIENYKKRLEELVGIQITTKDQIAEALKLLNRVIKRKNNDHINDCIELIVKTYGSNWTKNQTRHFNNCCTALQKHYDYFISFTSRNADEQNENKVNSSHKFFIRHILGPDKYNKDKNKRNLLAESINCLLKKELLNGFYYHDKEGDNTYVDEKLNEAIDKSFFFIQVVQNIMFDYVDPNYCFLEYEQAKKTIHENCMHYILAEKSHNDLIAKHYVTLDYDTWYEEVFRRDKIILEFTEKYILTQILEIKTKLQENLVNAINQLKLKYIEDVPGD